MILFGQYVHIQPILAKRNRLFYSSKRSNWLLRSHNLPSYCLLKVKQPESESDHSPISSAEDQNGGAIPSFSIRLYGLPLIKKWNSLMYIPTIIRATPFTFHIP